MWAGIQHVGEQLRANYVKSAMQCGPQNKVLLWVGVLWARIIIRYGFECISHILGLSKSNEAKPKMKHPSDIPMPIFVGFVSLMSHPLAICPRCNQRQD